MKILFVVISIVFFSINVVFAQTELLVGLPSALFKTDNNFYEIQYELTNATLDGTPLDLSARELLFYFNAIDDGQLIVHLPREIIDATRDGEDQSFRVFVGKDQGVSRIISDEIYNDEKIRVLAINFTKNDDFIGIVGTFFAERGSSTTMDNPFGTFSPLRQYELGIYAEDVICSDGLVLVVKVNKEFPACVKPETKIKLLERGWIKHVSLLETKFQEIKYDIEQTGYGICDIKLEESKIIIDLNWIFNDSSAEKEIISKIPFDVDYEIIYHNGYTDYFINEITSNTCDQLENEN
jgi:hypothetical protein